MNNTFRLFVSSTFSDFIKERAILNNEIFNKVSTFLKKKGCGFQIVDLRWGINTESALNQNTLEICLDEVNYCTGNSPKPNFLIMAGERYGWVPLPSSVAAEEFEKILAICDAAEKELLLKWYLLDKNNVPEIYYLNRRSGEYVDDNVWFAEEEKLHTILERKAKECGFDKETLIKYEASATEHEILRGLFENEDISDNVIVLMREGYPERDSDLSGTRALKNRIREKMEKDNLSDNIITLNFNDDYYRLMEEKVTELLIKNILSEFDRLEAEKEDYIPEKLPDGLFCGREADMESLKNYINSDERGIYFLTGDSGSGKTTLLKEFINFCCEYDPGAEYDAEIEEAKTKDSLKEAWAATKRYMNKKPIDVFCVLFGEDDVYDFFECIKRLCLMMVKEYDITLSEEINRYNIAKMFSETMGKTPSESKVVVVIDGIDMFYDINEINENIFPDKLMSDFKIIVSGADEGIVDRFIKADDIRYRIDGFSGEEALKSFDNNMGLRGRTLFSEEQKNIVKNALSEGANPLSCKLLSDLASTWHSDDTVKPFVFDDYEMAKMHIFDMFENCGHDESIVRYVLSYIAVAQFGIAEDDLLKLLFMHKEIKESFVKEDRYNYKLDKLPFAILSRLLYELKECIHHSMAKEGIIISFNHNVFRKVVLKEFRENCISAEDNLLLYYKSMDNYISEDRYPNTGKLMPLLSLLKKRGLYEEILKLLSDITFADAMIKSDNLTELCDLYTELNERELLDSVGKSLFECIRNNGSTLNCYKEGLFGCAQSCGIMEKCSAFTEFPSIGIGMGFDAGTEIYLSCDGKKYALIRDEYVYVYRVNAYRHYLSIHIKLEDFIISDKIARLVWTKDDLLVLVMESEEVYIYDVSGDVPKFEIRIDGVSETETVKYSARYNYLLLIRKNKLTAIEMSGYETIYEIGGLGTEFFDINENADEVLWLMKNSVAKRFSLRDGKFIKTDVFRYQSAGDEGSVCLFDKGVGVGIYNSYNTELRFVSGQVKKHIYFPESGDIKKFVKCQNHLVALYENAVMRADMNDFTLSYINVSGILNAYYIECEDALLVITDRGVRKISGKEFLPLPEKLYFSDKGVEASREMMIGFLFHLVKVNFSFETRRESFRSLFRKDNSLFGHTMAKSSELDEQYFKNVTYMAFSESSCVMLANEGEGKIRIYDGGGTELFRLSKLKFSVSNVIVGSEFSTDSKFLYILKTDGIILIDVEKKKVVSSFSFGKNPPEEVKFTEGGKIAFIKGGCHEFDISGKLERNYKKIGKRKYTNEEFEGFLYPCLGGAYLAEKFLQYSYTDYDYAGNYKNVYKTDRDILTFENGNFTLNGMAIENNYCDFSSVVREEFEKDNSRFACLMKIKNDMSSKLIRKGKMLFLVSYMLNSVIAFDTEKGEIAEARKWEGKIAGIREIPGGVEIYTESYPYRSRVIF